MSETKRLTAQEYYDLLVRTSRDGGFPACNPGESRCRYLTTDGKKCAVGLLFTSEQQRLVSDGWGVSNVLLQNAIGQDWIPKGIKISDLRQIQGSHDGIAAGECATHSDPDTEPAAPWDHQRFLTNINAMACFANVEKTIA